MKLTYIQPRWGCYNGLHYYHGFHPCYFSLILSWFHFMTFKMRMDENTYDGT
ncbi:MAG: hypothetical protein V4717_22725 [Bacteroidota bacterium]